MSMIQYMYTIARTPLLGPRVVEGHQALPLGVLVAANDPIARGRVSVRTRPLVVPRGRLCRRRLSGRRLSRRRARGPRRSLEEVGAGSGARVLRLLPAEGEGGPPVSCLGRGGRAAREQQRHDRRRVARDAFLHLQLRVRVRVRVRVRARARVRVRVRARARVRARVRVRVRVGNGARSKACLGAVLEGGA